jgi:hypothetical protein
MTSLFSTQPARKTLLTLFLAGLGCIVVYALALLRFPLLSAYNRPLQNLDRLTGSLPGTGLVIVGCILLLFAGYALGALALYQRRNPPLAASLFIVVLPLVFVGLLFFTYPTSSLDIYDYLFRGRMLARYEANTFVRVPADFATDPLMSSKPFRFIPWSRAVTAYGPLWEGMSWLTARAAGEVPGAPVQTIDPSLLRLMFAYKALGALGYLLCGAAVFATLCVSRPQYAWLGLYLWLWNPLALWESVAAGHNDAWMALLIVMAVWAFSLRLGQRNSAGTENAGGGAEAIRLSTVQPILSFLFLTLGGLIKYLALIFGPLFLAASFRALPTHRMWARLIWLGGGICGLLVMLAYAPFWAGIDTLRNFSDRGVLFNASWLAVLRSGFAESGLMAKEIAPRLAASLGTSLLMLGVGWSVWRAWREPERVAAHMLWLLLWFLFICNPWFQPWYLLWALALVAVQPWRETLVWSIVVFCATAMLSYIAGSFLLPVLGWHPEGAAWNLLQTICIYTPPLLILGWDALRPWSYSSRRSDLAAEARLE